MDTELLHRYFKGETSEKEENRIVEWAESNEQNKQRLLEERKVFDTLLFASGTDIQRKPKGYLYLYPIIAIASMLALVWVMDLPHAHRPAVPQTEIRADSLPPCPDKHHSNTSANF